MVGYQQVGAATHARWGGEPHIQLALANCSHLLARATSAMTSLPSRELSQEFPLLQLSLDADVNSSRFSKKGSKCFLCVKVYLYKWEGLVGLFVKSGLVCSLP